MTTSRRDEKGAASISAEASEVRVECTPHRRAAPLKDTARAVAAMEGISSVYACDLYADDACAARADATSPSPDTRRHPRARRGATLPPGLKETPVAELDAVLLVQPEQVAEMITAAIALSRTTAQTDLHLRPARKAEARV